MYSYDRGFSRPLTVENFPGRAAQQLISDLNIGLFLFGFSSFDDNSPIIPRVHRFKIKLYKKN